MSTKDKLSIVFRGHQIQILSNAPEVLSGLGEVFSAMLVVDVAELSEQIEVYKAEDQYQLRFNDQRKSIIDQSLGDILLHAEHEIVTWFIRKSPDLIWFHAGAAACQQRAILFVSQWGQGKSALVTALSLNGWKYLSDEVIPINPKTDELLPFPQLPKVRKASKKEISQDNVRDIEKIEYPLNWDDIVRTPLPVDAIIFPKFVHHAEAHIDTCSPATAVLNLVENCLNFDTHSPFAITYFSTLCQRIPTMHLQYNDRKLAAELIQQKISPALEVAQ